jgi:hypothetical protein
VFVDFHESSDFTKESDALLGASLKKGDDGRASFRMRIRI